MLKNGINLSRYVVNTNKFGDYVAFDIKEDTQVHGDLALRVINTERKYESPGLKRLHHNLTYHYHQISDEAHKILVEKLCEKHHTSAFGILGYLIQKSTFSAPMKPDEIHFHTKLYRTYMPSRLLCKKCGVSQRSVSYLYKVLRHYGFAIIHYGHITFSPYIVYSKSLALKSSAFKYYRYLLSQDKYGKKFLSNRLVQNELIELASR